MLLLPAPTNVQSIILAPAARHAYDHRLPRFHRTAIIPGSDPIEHAYV